MSRPPLANLFAVHDDDPAALDEIMLDLQHSGEFAEVWCPAPGWIAAAAPLPRGEPDGDVVRHHGFSFAEGRDVLENQTGKDPEERLKEIAEMADLRPYSLASLPGDFGFIRFRPGGSATVVRSCGGLVPFYLGQFNGRFAISTRLGDFVRYLPDEPRLDPLVNAIWASSWCMMPEGRTFLDGVTLLGRGHFARLEGEGQLQVARYWNPRPKRISYPTPALARQHAERLRTLLIEKLRRDLDPEGGNLLTLSGGVDSSSLAALAAGTLGLPVWTWSALPPQDKEDALQHALSYIQPLAEQYRFEHCWSVFHRDRLIFDLWRAAPRIVFHVLHPALCSLPGILKEAPVRVLFGGEYADKVCGSARTVPDWVAHTSLMRLFTDFEMLKEPKTVARWVKHRTARLLKGPMPPYPEKLIEMDPYGEKPLNLFRPEVQEEYRCWWEGSRQELMRDADAWPYLWLDSTTHDGFVVMNWEACSALGVRRSFPFFNREVLELAFECHPSELYGPGTKKLIRSALRGYVPERNLFRPDKGRRWQDSRSVYRSWQEPVTKGQLPEELETVLDARWFSHPPTLLDYWCFRPLSRLLIFIESLRVRRQEQGGAA